MDPARWQRITAIFDAALAAPNAERERLLSQLCAGDADLRTTVERLLAADVAAGEFLGQSSVDSARDASAAAAGPAPVRIGRYEVVERIGRGGFGEVYRAYDPELKRPVAIKTCLLEDPDVRRRFALEAEIAAPLDHPHITRVHDVGSDHGAPFLVQELLTGEDLQALIARRAPIPLATRLRWLAEAARGLAYAHARGVVHRDIKPANLRILESGQLKILDFGIARHQAASTVLTQAGAVLGTLAYMAPERMRAAHGAAPASSAPAAPSDHRADLYALGAVAYELCAHRRPFAGDSAPALLYAALHAGPVPLPAVWPECPRRLARLVAACLERDPARRPQSAEAVASELEAIGAGVDPEWVPVLTEGETHPPAGLLRSVRARLVATAIGVAFVLAAAWTGQRVLSRDSAPVAPTLRPTAASEGAAALDPVRGLLMIDALPWGEVIAVRSRSGSVQEIPGERTTPLAIALPPDFYTVTLRGPDLTTQRTCSVRLPAAGAVACTARFAARDAREFLVRMGS